MPAPKDPEKRALWKQRLSQSHMGKQVNLGRVQSEATKTKISETLTGRKPSPERHARQLEGIKRHTENITPEQRKKMGWSRGVPHTEKHNRRISEGSKGRAYTEVQRQALRTPEAEAKRRLGLKKAWEALPPEERERRSKKFVEAGRKGSKNHDTDIECFVARQLDALQIVYEKQKRIGLYAADFFIPADNLIIEVNGCFWHGCEICGFNEEMHYEKRAHDAKRLAYLESKGYTVGIIWEHDLRLFMDS